MTCREIISDAKKMGIFPTYLRGKTQHKTLQARLSEDIISQREASDFCRTSPGTFYLRGYLPSATDEFKAPRRAKSFRRSRVLCIPSDATPELSRCGIFQDTSQLMRSFESRSARYIRWDIANEMHDFKKIVTFTVIESDGAIFQYTHGKLVGLFPLLGRRTIGLYGHVNEYDIDLLNDDLVGIKRNAARQVISKLMPHARGTSDVDVINNLNIVGFVNSSDDEFCRTHVGVCLVYSPKERPSIPLRAKSLALNNPSWISKDGARKAELDSWSTLFLAHI
jgi:predicted NUDIX family phosphoesterase